MYMRDSLTRIVEAEGVTLALPLTGMGRKRCQPKEQMSASEWVVVNPGEKAELLAGLVARDPRAATAFFERYSGLIRARIFRVLGADADLADVLQDTFERILQAAPSMRSPVALEAWLAVIAARTAHKALRNRKRVPNALDPETLELLDAMTATWSTIDCQRRVALHAIARVVAQLPAEERQVFSLRYLDGLDMNELAAACDISVSTAKRRLVRARRFLMVNIRRHSELDSWLAAS